MSAIPHPGLPMPRRLQAIAAISLGMALVSLDSGIPNVALPTIAQDLGVPASETVLIVTIYQLILVMTLLPLSALGDRLGHQRLYRCGLTLFMGASLLCFFAKSLPFLLVVRAVQSLGAAAVLSVGSALVRAIYPAEILGRGLGLNTIVVASAAALAPSVGGLMLGLMPWPWIFTAGVPFALLSLLISRALPSTPPINEPYDVLGAVMCAAMFGLTIAGIESGVHGSSPVVSAAVALSGIAIGIAFVRRELGNERPILPLDLMRSPVLALSVAAALMVFVGSMTMLIALPFRLQHLYGFSPGEIGAMIVAWPMTMMIVSPLAGVLSDRIPAPLLGGTGMAVAVAGLLMLAQLPPTPSPFDISLRLSLCGVGFGLFLSPNARMMIGASPRSRAAAAGGLLATIRLTGQTVGATLAAALLALGAGDGATPALVAAGLALGAGLCSVSQYRARHH